ncbi:MAG: SCO family protein [Nitriliruptoraceae bacterium]
MSKRTGSIAILAVALVAAAATGVLLLRPDPELPGIVRDPAPDVLGLTFEDVWQREEPVTTDLVPPDGEITLAYFGYLSCPDMCPLTMADLRQARQLVGEELADRTNVAFVTVDPERDGPEELNAYLSLFFDHGVLALTAPDDAALTTAADQLGVRFELADAEPDGSYEVLHSAITYVIDDRGEVIRELPFGVSAEEFAEVIEATLAEEA